MKKCPYCDSLFPDDKKVCPECGSPYWKLGEDLEFKEIDGDSEDERNGCFSLLFLPVSMALLIAVFLVSVGFLLNFFIHIENDPVKVIWVLLSVAVGLFAYRFFNKKQGK